MSMMLAALALFGVVFISSSLVTGSLEAHIPGKPIYGRVAHSEAHTVDNGV